MRYEKSNRVGEVWHTEEYEGTPEEIAELIKQQKKTEAPTENPELSKENEFREG